MNLDQSQQSFRLLPLKSLRCGEILHGTLDWKDALQEEVRKQMIEYVSEDHFAFDYAGPFSPKEEN